MDRALERSVAPPGTGEHTALIVSFSLPSSAYATMALRELTMTDSSVAAQRAKTLAIFPERASKPRDFSWHDGGGRGGRGGGRGGRGGDRGDRGGRGGGRGAGRERSGNVCRDFQLGRCSRGDDCRFTHAAAGTEAGRGQCHAFAKGNCNRGNSCRYSHAGGGGGAKRPRQNESAPGDAEEAEEAAAAAAAAAPSAVAAEAAAAADEAASKPMAS